MLIKLGFDKVSRKKKTSTFRDNMLAGAASGFVTGVVSHPIDTLQVRRQVGSGSGLKRKFVSSVGKHFPRKRQSFKMRSVKTLKSLYKGFGLKTMKIVPSMAVSFATYTAMQNALKKTDTYK